MASVQAMPLGVLASWRFKAAARAKAGMTPAPPTSPGGLRIVDLKSPLAGPFSLEVPAGTALAVSGASGAGKSLFLRMIADLDPNTGEIFLGGVARSSLSAHAWRRGVPYVAAESGWWARDVKDHFPTDALDRARALAERLGVGAAPFDGPAERLSTGERQRLALVRALILDAPALLLDEPTGPLDPASTAHVEAVLKERLAAGAVLILVSHDPEQGARLDARRLRMVDRRLRPEDAA
jgi:ABC-type transport system involved in cytochrome bd biosynthesis fused ATPase/permease subunit